MHYTEPYLLNPQHPITIVVVGCGGTGSHVLTGLASMNESLLALGHPGLMVYAFDPDTVSPANIGRQKFSPADIGRNKAEVLITRLNRFYGFSWEAIPELYSAQRYTGNILLSCVDTIEAREYILNDFARQRDYEHPYMTPIYSMDFGNSTATGQVLLSSFYKIRQPEKEAVGKLKGLFQTFPGLKNLKGKDTGPSCSVAEALQRQELFVNSTLAQSGLNILWNLFREGKISVRGAYVDVKKVRTSPIAV